MAASSLVEVGVAEPGVDLQRRAALCAATWEHEDLPRRVLRTLFVVPAKRGVTVGLTQAAQE